MTPLYAIGLSLCLGTCLSAALFLRPTSQKTLEKAGKSSLWLLPFAGVFGGVCTLLSLSAERAADGAAWGHTVGLCIPFVAGLFGHGLADSALRAGDDLWRLLARVHFGLSCLVSLVLLVCWIAFASQTVTIGSEFPRGPALALYAVASTSLLTGLLFRIWRKGCNARVAGAGVLYVCLVLDYAWWLGFSTLPAIHAFGVCAYLVGHAYETRRAEQAELRALEARLAVATEQRSRLLLSASYLQHDRLTRLSDLTAAILHEINNPIQGLMNYVGMLRMMLRNGPVESGQLDKIDAEIDRVAQIARGISRFGKVEENGETSTDFLEVMHSTLALMKAPLRRQSIELQLNVAPELSPVRCHAVLLQQVLVHLLDNAREALAEREADDEHPRVLRIRVEHHQRSEGDFVVCSVEDNGKGMGPEVAAQVFTPFFTTKAECGGAGLGLALSQALVTDHGGSLCLRETGPGGSVFVLELPCIERGARDLLASA